MLLCVLLTALTVSRNTLRGLVGSSTVRKVAMLSPNHELLCCQWSGIIHVSYGRPAPFASSLALLFSRVVAGFVTSLSGEDPSVFVLESLSLSFINGIHPLRFCAPALKQFLQKLVPSLDCALFPADPSWYTCQIKPHRTSLRCRTGKKLLKLASTFQFDQ
jgi:hypothetical protein